MNSPIKVGMLGAGFILKPHALAVSSIKGATLHAVADTSLSRAEHAAKEFGFARAVGSVQALAETDCDIVHVLVPPFLHLEAAEILLKAGKSVFLEKPMGLSSTDCERLGALADANGLPFGVNHNFLFLPGYERLRSAVKEGAFGRLDHLTCNWNFELPQLRGGPFDAWMLSAPANLFFELGPHLAAFILDLAGEAAVNAAVAGSPKLLPTGKQAFRTWSVVGEGEGPTFSLSLSTRPGQPDRFIRLRASGGSAQFDFGRDIYWEERTSTANPTFDAHGVATGIAAQLRALAARDRRRRIGAALRKTLGSEPFTDSMARSIESFYRNFTSQIDERHHWRFGARTIRFCEDVCDRAGVGAPSDRPVSVPLPPQPLAPPKALVVGGTGFIGRALVSRLVENGVGVRVLSRSKSAAAAALSDVPVEIVEGLHGNAEVVRSALTGIETVYHLAKCEGKKWADYIRGDIEPTRVLAEEAARAGVTRFIYTGTIDSYDSASPRKRITSNTELDRRISSRNLYARSKAACERILKDAQERLGLPLIVLRPAIVIGRGTDPNHLGVAQFASETEVNYWGSGDNNLPLVLVDDVADALAKAMTAPDVIGKSFVLTSEPMLTARDYVAELSARSGVMVKATERSPWRYWVADLVKELAKNLVRHPNRRWPSLHDWRCRTHQAVYDSSEARLALGWEPVSDRDTMVRQGIHAAVDHATSN